MGHRNLHDGLLLGKADELERAGAAQLITGPGVISALSRSS
jgi:hypothetical protein